MTLSKVGLQPSNNNYRATYYEKLNNPQLTFGLFGKVELSERWMAQLHLDYSNRGTKVNDSGLDWYLLAVRPSYLDLNPILSFKPTSRFSIDIGGFYSYLLFIRSCAYSQGYRKCLNIPSTSGKVDLGWTLGASYWSVPFVVRLQYFHAYANIEASLIPPINKNRMLQLTVGYFFDLERKKK